MFQLVVTVIRMLSAEPLSPPTLNSEFIVPAQIPKDTPTLNSESTVPARIRKQPPISRAFAHAGGDRRLLYTAAGRE